MARLWSSSATRRRVRAILCTSSRMGRLSRGRWSSPPSAWTRTTDGGWYPTGACSSWITNASRRCGRCEEGNRAMNQGSGTVRIVTLEEAGDVDQMARDVRAGLLNMPKDLSPWPKYFYDAEGSRLFERITELPEYYQTRTELSILKEKAREIVARARCREIVELGSGSASKTRTLLDAMLETPAHDGVPSG